MRQLLSELDAIAEAKRKGDAFERATKWVLQNAPLYATQLKAVWLWDEFPRNWGPDTGIDLIAEPVEGKLWAIQSKAYAPDASVTWRDFSTFVGASAARREIGHLVLVTTAGSVAPNALKQLRTCGKSFTILTRDKLLELGLADVTLHDLKPKKVARFKPRTHQKEAIQEALKGFKKHDRGQLILACGTGKTLTALWIHERLKARRTVVFVPSLALLAQTLREWTRHAVRPFAALAVCSDMTSTEVDPWTSSVSEIGLPATTDASQLRAALKKHREVVVFATYQSSAVVESALKRTKLSFDLMILDEAHRATGLEGSEFTRPVRNNAIRADRRLFMTATSRIYGPRSKKAAEDEDLLLCSMDDEAIYGPRFHTLSFSEAIERDLLTDYRVVIVGVDNEDVARLAKLKQFVTRGDGEVIPASELASHIAVAKAMRRFGSRRMISFHSRVRRARQFADDFPGVVQWMGGRRGPGGYVWADSIRGSMSVRERTKILKRLAAVADHEYGLVSNARCLGEGVDVPLIDGIAFIDPKNSQVDIVQAVGRAIRKAEAKTDVSTVVLPVFIQPDEDIETNLDSSEFKALWRVVDALRSHDDALGEELDALRRGLARRRSRGKLPPKIVFDLPTKVGKTFADALSVRLLEKVTSSWEYGFGKLQGFVETNGTARVPDAYEDPADGFRLGSWVRTRRVEYRKSTLSLERVALLEALPGWTWDPFAAVFEEGLGALQRYVESHGTASVPQGYRDPGDGFQLGRWVGRRRTDYQKGRLDPERIARLEALPGWTWEPLAEYFEKGCEALQRYVEANGTARVPHGYEHSTDGFPLSAWVARRRADYQAGRLSSERIVLLEAFRGWIWDPRASDFDEGLKALDEFIAREGNALVPTSHMEGDFRLGQWVHNRQSYYLMDKVPRWQIEELEARPQWVWDPGRARLKPWLEALRQFVHREGNALVPQGHEEAGLALGVWVNTMRTNYQRGKLDEGLVKELEAMPGWSWNPRKDSSLRYLEALDDFIRREGNATVKATHVEEGLNLGYWVSNQRQAYKRGKLDVDMVKTLEARPGWSWNPRWDSYLKHLAALDSFIAREGHAMVPDRQVESGLRLGSWVSIQRQAHKKGVLDDDRIRDLEARSGWVWEAGPKKKEPALPTRDR